MRYIDHSEENDTPRLIMEYFPLGDLAGQVEAKDLSKVELADVFEGSLSALAFLHKNGIIHR